MRTHLKTGLIAFVLSIAWFFFPCPVKASKPPLPSSQVQAIGSISIGPMTVPYKDDWFPDVRISSTFFCHASEFCRRFQVQFLQSDVFLSFANDTFQEKGLGITKEHHLPFFKTTLSSIALTLPRRWMLTFSKVELSRSIRTQEENLNAQFTLATLRIPFSEVATNIAQGHCFFDATSIGVKSIHYARSETVPFLGMLLGGFKQGCHYELGPQKVAATLGYTLRSEVSIGQSGHGAPNRPGSFGAVLSEHRLEFHAGIKLSPFLSSARPNLSFQILGFIQGGYHMSRGCLQNLDPTIATCGNNTSTIDVRAGVLFRIDFGQKTTPPFAESPLAFGL